MRDAFGNELQEGDSVIGIANLPSTQTFYLGTVTSVTEDWASVTMMHASDAYIEEYKYIVDSCENRIAPPHRLMKL